MVPKLSELSEKVKLGVDDGKEVSSTNAALAVQLSTCFLKQKFPQRLKLTKREHETPFSQNCKELSFAHIEGLAATQWHGRFQVDKLINMHVSILVLSLV